jgi:hypothetical protein
MALAHRFRFTGRQQPLPRILANRVQQSVALGTVGVVGEHERFADQFCKQVKYVFQRDPLVGADRFCGFQAPASITPTPVPAPWTYGHVRRVLEAAWQAHLLTPPQDAAD